MTTTPEGVALTTVIFPLFGHAVQFSRSGEGATGGLPRLVSQNSAVRARGRTRRQRAPDSVDVLDAPNEAPRAKPRACPRRGEAIPSAAGSLCELPRKEVIQPHLPLRLPCYDFTPVTSPTFDGSLPQGVRPPASGVAHSRGVTGGVYKARERIHRGNADPRLLATPPSCRRVSACNPNRDAL